MKDAVNKFSIRVATKAAHVLGFPIWFVGLLVAIPTWFLLYAFSRGHIDPGLGTLVVVLTVQTSIDSGASNFSLRQAKAADDERMAEIAALTTAIKDEQDNTRERDAQAEQRDAAQLEVMNHVVDRLESIEQRLNQILSKGGSNA